MTTVDALDQEAILERIAELEEQIASHGNATRDAMIEQGDLLNKAAPGGGKALEEIAAKCGLSVSNARVRKSVSAKLDVGTDLGREARRLLVEHEDVYVSFDALNSVLNDAEPLALLTTLLTEARAAGGDRITRDAVRRGRGKAPGTVGTPEATKDRMLRDREYMLALLADPEVADAIEGNDEVQKALSEAYNRSQGTKSMRAKMTRAANAAAATAADEGPRMVTAGDALQALWSVDLVLDKVLEHGTSDLDEESASVLNLFADSLQVKARYARSLADGDHVAPSGEDFDAALEALLDAGDPR
jgi:hypothetical protein